MEIMWSVVDFINSYIWMGIPGILKGLITALVIVIIFRKLIKKHPIVFYIYPTLYCLWAIVSFVGNLLTDDFYQVMGGEKSWIWNIVYMAEELGLGVMLGISLLVIVMFVGVLPQSRLVKNLLAIRTEMSIMGATILAGHGIGYFPTEVTGMGTLDIFLFIILGPILLTLLILPWITSYRVVRKKMSFATWKKLQTYLGVPLFIGMLLFGLVLNLDCTIGMYEITDTWEITNLPWDESTPVSLGWGVVFSEQLLAAKIYAFLLVAYIVLRIKKVRGKTSSVEQALEQTQQVNH
jgi:DMSO/TMAO reductase YedYZ heme-binding membrane subunit